MSPAFVHAEETAAEVAFVRLASVFATIALLLYETCQTADLELLYIWTSGHIRMIILFVTIRHVQLVGLVMNSITFTVISPVTCTTLTLINGFLVVIPYFGWAVFLGWRAYALSSRNRFVTLLIFVCGVSFISPSLLELIGTRDSYIATTNPPSCAAVYKWVNATFFVSQLAIASRVANLFAEVIVLGLTCKKTYRTWFSLKKSGRQRSLPDVLHQNGVICFFVVTIVNLISLLFSTVPVLSLQDLDTVTISVFRDGIITVVLSRFILELAKLGVQMRNAEQGAQVTRGILTTEWSEDCSDIPSQWTLDEEYNGRGFDKVETWELQARYEG